MNLQLFSSVFLLLLSCVLGKPQYRLRQSTTHVQHPQSTTGILKTKQRRVRKLCGKSGKSGKSGKDGRRRNLEDVCDDDYYTADDDARTFPPMGKGKGARLSTTDAIPSAGGSTFDDDTLVEPVAPMTGEDPLATAAPVAQDDEIVAPVEQDDETVAAVEEDDVAPRADDDETDDSANDSTDDGPAGTVDTGDDDISISNEDLGINGFPDDDFSISNEEPEQTDDEVSNDP